MDWRAKVKELRLQLVILYQASRDPRLPWYIKLLPWLVIAYALSPIDLIPDFIPVLGYLDDLLLIPLGIIIALRLIPESYKAEYREKAREISLPGTKVGIILVAAIWLVLLSLILFTWLR